MAESLEFYTLGTAGPNFNNCNTLWASLGLMLTTVTQLGRCKAQWPARSSKNCLETWRTKYDRGKLRNDPGTRPGTQGKRSPSKLPWELEPIQSETRFQKQKTPKACNLQPNNKPLEAQQESFRNSPAKHQILEEPKRTTRPLEQLWGTPTHAPQ